MAPRWDLVNPSAASGVAVWKQKDRGGLPLSCQSFSPAHHLLDLSTHGLELGPNRPTVHDSNIASACMQLCQSR